MHEIQKKKNNFEFNINKYVSAFFKEKSVCE